MFLIIVRVGEQLLSSINVMFPFVGEHNQVDMNGLPCLSRNDTADLKAI
jgi:hypothetical protein